MNFLRFELYYNHNFTLTP